MVLLEEFFKGLLYQKKAFPHSLWKMASKKINQSHENAFVDIKATTMKKNCEW